MPIDSIGENLHILMKMPIEILQSIQQKWIVKLKSLSIKKLYVLICPAR